VDYNVPIVDGLITDITRISSTISTIEYILKKNSNNIIIISHLGRPEGKKNKKYSLEPISKKLSELIKR
jgi:phosphoglycerate kinase